MQKRVLFVERNLINEKLGIMYLSAVLKAKGHHANLIQTDKDDLDDFIRDYRPDYVAFSIMTGQHVHALQVARYVKAKYGIPSLVGGPHATFFPEIGFEDDLDFVVQGQSESVICDIVEGRVAPGFVKAEMPHHLDDLPHPDREIFYQYPEFKSRPMKNVMTSRACPFKCSYCFNHSQYALTKIDGETKRWFNRRSMPGIVAEIENIQKHYPLEKINFADDTFIQSADWTNEFLKVYTREVRLPWICSVRANSFNDLVAQKMAESGLEMVSYAMESADPDVQQRLLNRGHIENSDIVRAIHLLSKHGIRARMQNIIGLPLENPLEDALNTIQFNMQHRVADSWCSIFQPYPRTALGQYCVDHGYATDDQLKYCTESFFDESRLNIRNTREIYALQKLWYFAVEGQVSLDLLQILIRGHMTKAIGDQIQKLRYEYSRKKTFRIQNLDSEASKNFQSRECWSNQEDRFEVKPGPQASLITQALKGLAFEPRLIDVLTQLEFSQKDENDLQSFIQGKRVYPDPINTLNPETGLLKDPSVSIYIRGVKNPEAQDIRKMPDVHFMKNMVEIRQQLMSRNRTKADSSTETQSAINHSQTALKAEVDGIKSKHHLNNYLG